MNPQPQTEVYERSNLWDKTRAFVGGIFGSEEMDDDDADGIRADGTAVVSQPNRSQPSLRIQTATRGSVAVRLNAQVFEDAKLAADGLKSGEYQIVNLEKATPQMAERIIDFLNGVCYALDGTVERVGTRVYMFVPANVSVDVDSGATAAAGSRKSPFGETRD